MHNPGLHRFATLTAAATFCLIVAGALVTSNEAGLAVPDWPLSYGSLMPPWVGNIRYEHSHRLAAGVVLLLTAALAAWLARRETRRWVRRLGYAALGAVLAQALLGGITVLFLLPMPVSVLHAVLAQAFFSTTVILALVTGRDWAAPAAAVLDAARPSLAVLAKAGAAGVLAQLLLGAALRHQGLGIIPHLVGAGVVMGLALWILARVSGRHFLEARLLRPAAAQALLVTFQLVLGATAYLARLATQDAVQPLPLVIWPTVAHVAVGALTLAAAVWMAVEAWRLTAEAVS